MNSKSSNYLNQRNKQYHWKVLSFFSTFSLCLSPLLFEVPLAILDVPSFYCVLFVCYQVESTPEEKGKRAYCGYYFFYFLTLPSSPGSRLLMPS